MEVNIHNHVCKLQSLIKSYQACTKLQSKNLDNLQGLLKQRQLELVNTRVELVNLLEELGVSFL